MAFLTKLSIKWKLSLALITTGLTLISLYVFIAKQIFESDKISYVFDSQASRLESTKSEIESKFKSALSTARSVIVTFDLNLGKPSQAGEQAFQDEKTLLALELWNESKNQTVFRLAKDSSALPPADGGTSSLPLGQMTLLPLGNDRFLLSYRYSQGENEFLVLRAALGMTDLLPKVSATQSLMLTQNKKIVAVSDIRGIDSTVFQEIAQDSEDATNKTRIWNSSNDRFLISEATLGIGDLRIVALTPEAEALGALGTLFKRSVIFLLFSGFGLVLISLTIARGLTTNLVVLTRTAEEIGSGNFDSAPAIHSQDEMGVLAKAFAKMSQEIKRLLHETREKTRMEAELKTASLIQERLLPAKATALLGEMEINGLILNSSECGGDWWYFFTRGDEIFVAIADATGHGTPAALITAAARSAFAQFETDDLSLVEMLKAWDISIASCGQKQVFMTGILIRINSTTGEGAFVNAAHESPFVFRANDDGTYAFDQLDTEVSKRLGDGAGAKVVESPFSLAPNESIVLYTDGLFSVTLPNGKTLSERRFGKQLAARAEFIQTADQMTATTLDAFNEHRANEPIPDDVSIVSIRRKGPVRTALLENDTGVVQISVAN